MSHAFARHCLRRHSLLKARCVKQAPHAIMHGSASKDAALPLHHVPQLLHMEILISDARPGPSKNKILSGPRVGPLSGFSRRLIVRPGTNASDRKWPMAAGR